MRGPSAQPLSGACLQDWAFALSVKLLQLRSEVGNRRRILDAAALQVVDIFL